MLAELRAKAQVTIPKEIVSSLGLSQGDKLEIYEKDGVICIVPVVVYPKKYVEQLMSEVDSIHEEIRRGKRIGYDSIDELFKHLEK